MATGWTWDAQTKSYRSPSGKKLSTKATAQLRDAFAAARSEMARAMAEQLAAGDITAAEFATQFTAFIEDTVTAGYLAGRGGVNAVADSDLDAILNLITDQLDFADAFTKDLEGLSADAVATRASLYGDAAVKSFELGKAASHEVDLPGYPGDWETECKAGCRCFWEITTDAEGATEYRWITASDGAVCEDCAGRGRDWNPWVPEA